MKDNIVLIGMPGVGKSTVGVVLAKALGYNFVDADLVIQQQTGKLLCELIAEHGTEGFLEIEDEVNSSIEGHKAVIATGGSAVYCAKAMEHYKEIATVLMTYGRKNTLLSTLVSFLAQFKRHAIKSPSTLTATLTVIVILSVTPIALSNRSS